MASETALEIARRADALAQQAVIRLNGHEDRCDERQAAMIAQIHEIREGQKEIRNTILTFSKIAVGVMIALIGWGGATIYGTLAAKTNQPSVVQVTNSAPPLRK